MLAPRKKLWSTPRSCIEAVVEWGSITRDDILYDVGCGDGRVLLTIAELLKDEAPRKMVGIEIDQKRAEEAKSNILAAKASLDAGIEIDILCANALEIDYNEATILFLYLIPRGLRMIKPILQKNRHELRVITYIAGFDDEKPDKVHKVQHQNGSAWPIYFYRLQTKIK